MKAQVLDLCEMIAKSGNTLNFLHFAHPKMADKDREILEASLPQGTKVIVQPVWFTNFHFRRLNWIFLRPSQSIVARLFIRRAIKRLLSSTDLFHFRAYPAATVIPWLTQNTPTIHTIFDPRSPYPEELVTLGICKKNSAQHRFWNKQEAEIIKQASKTVATTEPFASSLTQKVGNAPQKIHVIPNNVCPNRFKLNQSTRLEVRQQLDISNNTLVFGYVGSLGLSSWNRPQVYIDFMKQLILSKLDFCMLFVTKSVEILSKELIRNNIDSKFYRIESASFEKVPFFMCSMDLSLNLMVKHDPRLSIKTVEYLAAGLPVITNAKAEGVANLVRTQNLGIVFDDEKSISSSDIAALKALVDNREAYALRAKEYVQNHCSTQAVAKTYIKLYKSLFKN